MQKTPLLTMTDDEFCCFCRAMEQWRNSLTRTDLCEEDRIKGALLAYQRQAFAIEIGKVVLDENSSR